MLYLKNISYHPPATPTPILKGINLELSSQKLGVIIGPSGSGKTTLLEILAGLAQQTKGEIFWRDQELTPLHLQQLAGIVFQFPERHFCGKTILEELRLGHPEISRTQVQDALKEVGLDDLPLNSSPYHLSGGQQRRLALAVQLVRQPNVLMLDDQSKPAVGSSRHKLAQLVAKLKEFWTILVVTHDPGELLQYADFCWKINNGELTINNL